MKETHDFLVPDYFPRFACKMGECRAACCRGWPVSISMENYFRLLGKLDELGMITPYGTGHKR